MRCSICNSESIKVYKISNTNYGNFSQIFPIFKCDTCEHGFSPSAPSQAYWYAKCLPQDELTNSLGIKWYAHAVLGYLNDNLSTCSTYIDYGCGKGEFIGELSKSSSFSNKTLCAYDSDPRRFKLDDSSVHYFDSPDRLYEYLNDATVFLFDVLEHVESPEKFIVDFFERGVRRVIISVPNFARSMFIEDFKYIDFPPAHLQYFCTASVAVLANRLNCTVNHLSYNPPKRSYTKKLMKMLALRIIERFSMSYSRKFYNNPSKLIFAILSPLVLIQLVLNPRLFFGLNDHHLLFSLERGATN